MALLTNIVSYYKLDESSGNAADSHGSNTLTNNATTAYVAAKINNGADLESASSQYFSIADASQTGLDLGAEWSVSMWIKPESSGTNALFGKWDEDNNLRSYRPVLFSNNEIVIYTSAAGTTAVTADWTGLTISNGTWYHLVMINSVAEGLSYLYIDGVSQGTKPVGTTCFNGTAPFMIGADQTGAADAAANFFDGIIDEVGVWSRVLTSGEVTSLYASGAGLQYPFGEGATSGKNFFAFMV